MLVFTVKIEPFRNFRAVSEQFQSSFRAVSEQFRSSFRAVSEQFQKSFRAVSEQFQSSFRAVSEFNWIQLNWLPFKCVGVVSTKKNGNFFFFVNVMKMMAIISGGGGAGEHVTWSRDAEQVLRWAEPTTCTDAN